jgi:hydrogenase/urease accessory protein HupE
MIRWLLGLLAWLALIPAAHADELRPGYLEFTQIGHDQAGQSEWRLVWKAPLRGGVSPETQPVLPAGCATIAPADRTLGDLAVIATARIACKGDVAGKSIGLSHFSASQTDVLVRVAPLGRPVQALRLTASQPVAEIKARPEALQVARTYFVIGTQHILFGYDHLLFVVALVLLLGRFWPIAKAATAFTVAHSITLIGTTLGVLGLPQQPVEAMIALSIVFLAVEIAKRREGESRLSERAPWVVAFLFGLLHGFGFAGALKEIGLPESDVPTALLTFNLGVEAGQIVIIGGTLAVVEAIRRMRPALLEPAMKLSTYAIGTVACMWLFERTLL